MTEMNDKTIRDFGDQWTHYPNNEGYYASLDFFKDICGPLVDLSDLQGKTVLDIGSGTGRIVKMLLDSGASRVIAVEPSGAFKKLVENTRPWEEKIEYLNLKGEDIPDLKVDYAFSIGVLHHIPDPQPTIRRVLDCLEPGGKFLIWVYGFEGNELYLSLIQPLRKLTSIVPDIMLVGLAHIFNFFLSVYICFNKFIVLPFHRYLREVLAKLSRRDRFLVIFDQLNPAYARYYRREEAENLLKKTGFVNVVSFHRHAYSWTVLGEKE